MDSDIINGAIDSGFDSEYSDGTISVNSDTYQHRYGKRRYHGMVNNPYPFPNDEFEIARLDKLQFCMRRLMGGNVLVPFLNKPSQIVDVGTGTGAWAIEVADQFPTAIVYGTDISPIQHTFVPINVEFIVMDLNEGLEFDDGSTDLVHSRFVHAGITISQWPKYLYEIIRILNPGHGWAQMIELGYPYVLSDNNGLPDDAPVNRLSRYLQKHLRDKKKIILDGRELERLMLQAGFVDVTARIIKIEVGDWGPDPDKHEVARDLVSVWSGAMMGLAELLSQDIPEEDFSEFVRGVQSDIENKSYQIYCNLCYAKLEYV